MKFFFSSLVLIVVLAFAGQQVQAEETASSDTVVADVGDQCLGTINVVNEVSAPECIQEIAEAEEVVANDSVIVSVSSDERNFEYWMRNQYCYNSTHRTWSWYGASHQFLLGSQVSSKDYFKSTNRSWSWYGSPHQFLMG